MIRCPGCGTYASPGVSFCTQCGQRLADEPAGASPTQPHGLPVAWGQPPYPGARPDGEPETWVTDPGTSWPVDPTWGQGPPPAGSPPAWSTTFEQAPPAEHGQWSAGGYPYGGYPPEPPPGPWQQRPPGRGHGRTVLFSALALVVVLGLVGGGFFLTRDGDESSANEQHSTAPSTMATGTSGAASSSSASPSTPKAQAKAVNVVLDDATSGKSNLSGAYSKALACKISPAKAEKKFAATARNRRATVAKARKLDTSKLSKGATIKRRLITMYTTSAKADEAFTKWARAGDAAGVDCLESTAKRRKGNRLSVKAGRQKGKFTKVWNPVARDYGYETRSRDDL